MKGGKIKRLPLILLLPLILSFVGLVSAPIAVPEVSADPPEISANPTESFTVNVAIADVLDLYSYEAKLGFNPELLQPVSVTEGPFIKDGTTSPLGTFFSPIIESDFVYVACVTLGRYPGVSGSGVLFSVNFNVLDAGTCDLSVYDTILLDSTTPAPQPITHTTANGYFYTSASANLVARSAWPEHHHFVVSKDEDGNQTLNGKVTNLGPLDLQVRLEVDLIRDDALITTVVSDTVVLAPGTTVVLTADFGPLTPLDAGKYYASCRAFYSWSGAYWAPGAKNKTFSFAVVP